MMRNSNSAISSRADELFAAHHAAILRRTDHLFAYLMGFQFVAGIIAALLISPQAWTGSRSEVHIHVWAALIIGGLLASFPIALAIAIPGRFITRCVIATGQMLTSGLLIHLCGGRIETHFHVFGSLAFLVFYRDWRVFIPATVVVALDHLIRGFLWPQSVYGVLTATPWRSVEHAGWVLFENFFLIQACIHGMQEMREIALKRAELEETKAATEDQVRERTAELVVKTSALESEIADRRQVEQSLRELNMALANAMPGMSRLDPAGRYTLVNDTYADMLGYQPADLIGTTWHRTVHPDDIAAAEESYARMQSTGIAEFRARAVRKDGSTFYKHVMLVRISHADGQMVGHHCLVRDVTEQKKAEDEREQLHKQLVETSRQAGMTEVATGVLHNVGNVLNSVNVSAEIVADKVRRSPGPTLSQIADMVHEHSHDLAQFLTADEKGMLIPQYLTKLGSALANEQSDLLGELTSLTKNIEHIKQIVSMQQSYARVSGVIERVSVMELIEDAIRINASALDRHGITLTRRLSEVPPIDLDKQKVLQILVNLISNAKHALAEGKKPDKQITITLTSDAASDRVRIEVTDNGVGILPENITRIFSHGFTTRRHGHGFGLHSSSLAAKAMGGALIPQSDGLGHGAKFTLELPMGMTVKK